MRLTELTCLTFISIIKVRQVYSQNIGNENFNFHKRKNTVKTPGTITYINENATPCQKYS